ncbi:uncharacterized protein [Parasteatoda tepidariorum]|uniref:uncharacterized protein n=1 Tax=Parasteatoda tepidariorum TaxID=114398 RepID=UPI0039BD17F7
MYVLFLYQNQPGPSSGGSVFVEGVPAPSNEVKNAIVLTPLHQRTYQTYRANEASYRARIDIDRIPDYLRERPLIAAVEAVRELFGTLMQRTFEGLAPMDLVRFCIQAEGLDKPISSHLQRVDAFTLEKLLAIVLKVLQSKDKIRLVDGFVVDIITVKRDVGAGVDRKVINVQVDRLRKQSIIPIDNDELGLCCTKSIVRAIAHVDKDIAAINAFRDKRRPALFNKAVKLHEDAGVPLGPCTYSEIAVFEDYLDTQIVVFSTENSNRVCCVIQK